MRPTALGLAMTAALAIAKPATAQQRPLVTQDPDVVGEGRLLVETGVETGANIWYPVSGLTGDRIALPIGVTVGAGKVVELQLSTGYQWLSIDQRDFAPLDFRVRPGDHTSDAIDLSLATKVRLLAEGARWPAIGARFATELPNAGNESGLGLDTLNFSGTLLAGKTIGPVRLVVNGGVALLSDVLQGSLQQDAFLGGVAAVWTLTPAFDIAAEFAGRKVLFADLPPIGAEPRGAVRAALRHTRRAWRIDGGAVIGTTRQDPDFGVSVGLTWLGRYR